jgi:hypothetical protein
MLSVGESPEEHSMSTVEKDLDAYGKIVARAWRDPAFKARLLADPAAVFEEAGVSIPAGAEVSVLESTASRHYFVLPPRPTQELSDESLDRVSGGRHPTCKKDPLSHLCV